MTIVARGHRALPFLSLLLAGCLQNQVFGAGGGPPGKCKIPTDTPVFSPASYWGACYSPTKPAPQTDACPDHYFSDGQGGCACADQAFCGLACAASQDCVEPYLECDTAAGACRPVLTCFSSAACPNGTACLHGQAQDTDACLPLGTEPVGAACGWNGDCASGVCVAAGGPATCVPPCLRTSDCPSGLVCAAVTTQYAGPPWQFAENASASWTRPDEPAQALGCVAQAPCAGGCPSDGFCNGTMCAVACLRSADCPGGGCVATNNSGICTSTAGECAPTEAVVYAQSSASGPVAYCINYVSCYGDEACASPYACVLLLDQFATESAYTTDWDNGAPGLCARAAP